MPIPSYNSNSLPTRATLPALARPLANLGGAPAGASASGAPAATSHADRVSLSDAGKALQNHSGSGQLSQADADQEAKVLGDLTRKSLSLLGITNAADASGATISFDSLTYEASSSSSFSTSQQSGSLTSTAQDGSSTAAYANAQTTQFHSEQQATYSGKGHITTADGRQFEFNAELQVDNVTDIRQSSSSAGSSTSAGSAGNTGGTGTIPAASLPAAGAPSATDQLLDLLRQTGNQVVGNSQAATADTSAPAAASDKQSTLLDYLKSLDAKALDFQKLLSGAAHLLDQFTAQATQTAPAASQIDAHA
jgi:hypothetical protein